MDGLSHQLFAGVAAGSIYALLGLAAVMVYQSTHHLNFAQGEMATFSTYFGWFLLSLGVPYWLAFLCTVAASFVLGVLLERLLVSRVRHAPPLVSILVFIALLIIFNSLSGALFGYTPKTFPSPFRDLGWLQNPLLTRHETGTLLVSLIVLGALYLFFAKTRIGLVMRGSAHNSESALLCGVPVRWMTACGWGLAAGIGAIAGMLVAPSVFLDPNMMSGVLIYGFVAALVGGLDSAPGAIVGGMLVGVVENLLGAYVIGTELKMSAALVLMVVLLLVKPSGLFGRVVVWRV